MARYCDSRTGTFCSAEPLAGSIGRTFSLYDAGQEWEALFPGYLTVGFYWNSDIVSAFSISEETGQVVKYWISTNVQSSIIRAFSPLEGT